MRELVAQDSVGIAGVGADDDGVGAWKGEPRTPARRAAMQKPTELLVAPHHDQAKRSRRAASQSKPVVGSLGGLRQTEPEAQIRLARYHDDFTVSCPLEIGRGNLLQQQRQEVERTTSSPRSTRSSRS